MNILKEVLAISIRKNKKTHPERNKTVFSDKLILYIENPKGSEKMKDEYHLQLISEFSEVTW